MNLDDNKDKIGKLDDALDIMETSSVLSDEKIQENLKDDSCKKACRDILDYTYVLSQKESIVPDVEAELHRFKNNHKSHIKRYVWSSVAGIAAMIAIAVTVYFYVNHEPEVLQPSSYTVFSANNTPQQITLQTSSGNKVVIDKQSSTSVQLEKCIASIQSQVISSKVNSNIQTRTLTIPCGQTFKITLADGSEVWLNANSSFIYPTHFTGDQRVVYLEGEAYFKVTKDREHPFIVKTKYLKTQVYGTEFNVKSYSPDDSHVVLITGSVSVTSLKSNASKMIVPGEDAHLSSSGDIMTDKVDIESYLYWKDGYFYFDQEPLKNIMQSIGRWYNVSVEFTNKSDMNYVMHFAADRTMGLPHIITLLNRMKKVTVTLDDNKITVN
jgi:transmembrane sensor